MEDLLGSSLGPGTLQMSTPQHSSAHLYATCPSVAPPSPVTISCGSWPSVLNLAGQSFLCSFDFPSLALITGSHLLFLFPRASCFRLAPAGLARPSEGAREAGWDCLSSSAQVGEMSQLARVTVSPRLEPQTVFLEGLAWLPISHYFIYSVRSL